MFVGGVCRGFAGRGVAIVVPRGQKRTLNDLADANTGDEVATADGRVEPAIKGQLVSMYTNPYRVVESVKDTGNGGRRGNGRRGIRTSSPSGRAWKCP